MSDPKDQSTMSREPDVVDEMSAAQGWTKHMQVITPEQRERMASLEFPRVAESSNVRPADPAREARYAEAIIGADPETSPRHPEAWAWEARAVMAVADEERAADRAEIERLRDRKNTYHSLAESGRVRAESAEARLDALVADLRGLADEWGSWSIGIVPAATAAKTIRNLLDKHAGEVKS